MVTPTHNQITFNFDGAFLPEDGLSSTGEMIRDNQARHVLALAGQMIALLVTEIELLALFEGLNLATHFKLQDLIIEGEQSLIMDTLNRGSTLFWRLMNISTNIIYLIQHIGVWDSHI